MPSTHSPDIFDKEQTLKYHAIDTLFKVLVFQANVSNQAPENLPWVGRGPRINLEMIFCMPVQRIQNPWHFTQPCNKLNQVALSLIEIPSNPCVPSSAQEMQHKIRVYWAIRQTVMSTLNNRVFCPEILSNGQVDFEQAGLSKAKNVITVMIITNMCVCVAVHVMSSLYVCPLYPYGNSYLFCRRQRQIICTEDALHHF